MKAKITGLVFCVIVILAAVIIQFRPTNKNERYHQHIEAAEKAECTDHGSETFCTHLPLISIDTGGIEIPGVPILENGQRVGYTSAQDGSDEIVCTISVFDNESKNNHLTDTPSHKTLSKIRVRGNSSRYFDKLGYLLNFETETGENNPLPVMGMDSHHEWTLHGPYLDKTLLRNYMSYNIAGEVMDYAPNVRFCEVYLNGEYNGVYVLTETVTAGKEGGRLNLEVDKKNNTFSGYCLRVDRGSSSPIKNIDTFSIYSLRVKTSKINITYPGTSNLTPELAENIRQDFSDFEKTLYSFEYDNGEYGFMNRIDANSFIDCFLLNEFTCNYDAMTFSTYIYKDIEGRYKMCVWDFNNAYDNYQETAMELDDTVLHEGIWYFMLMKDRDFCDMTIDRYRYLRKSVLSDEYLFDYIDDTVEYLGPAIDRNFEKWGNSFEDETLLTPAERNLHSYDEAIEQIKDFIVKRGVWLDENIESIRQYSAESKTKIYNEYTK